MTQQPEKAQQQRKNIGDVQLEVRDVPTPISALASVEISDVGTDIAHITVTPSDKEHTSAITDALTSGGYDVARNGDKIDVTVRVAGA
ncbi:hypothetical protein [Streptomyces sp. NPDC008141]|uniref:hypothetical protein n=1 Tax=Streptomyces sp. NPDC008141 TaxID=3364815 RepID=UPI0036EBDAC2